jgi:hypothetical protein
MPVSFVSSLLSPTPLKVMNVTRGFQVMRQVKVLRTKAYLSAAAMRHMLEDGNSIIDTRIILPCSLEIEFICPDLNVAGQVMGVFEDRSSLYQITSKGLIFDNMMLMHDGISQTPENLSSIPTRIMFQQILLEGTQQKITAQPGDASIVDRGIAALNNAAQTAQDLFSRAREQVGKVLGV